MATLATIFSRHSLAARATLLFVAVSALLVTEIILGIQMGRRMEASGAALTDIDRRARAVLLGAGKMNDVLYELSALEYANGVVTPTVLGHIHSQLRILAPIEGELRREGRDAVGILRAVELSSALQSDPTPLKVMQFVRDVRPAVEMLAAEVLQLLVDIDQSRKAEIRLAEEGRRHIGFLMLALGIGGTVLIVIASIVFFSHLIRDLRQIRGKAELIRSGEFGSPLPTGRKDEMGEAMAAINQLAADLQERDRQIDDLRIRFSQNEKMMALGTFATGMAHEIGNPIQAISALCEQVVETLTVDYSKESVQANICLVEVINEQANRLARTISEIREFAYQGEAEAELADVNELVRTTVSLMRFDPRFRRTPIDIDCRAEHSLINAVPDHLVQVVINLLVNAADAVGGHEGRVSIATEDAHNGVVIKVVDTGSGMSEAVLKRACEPFFTTKPRNIGTGMGLAICRSIIEEHRGSMEIASRPGEGTTVKLTLPLGQPQTTERGQPS